MKTTTGRRSRRASSATSIVCCLVLSLSFFESQAADAATTAATAGAPPETPAASAGHSNSRQNYFGTLIGRLSSATKQVSGEVYAVDEQTLFIRNFNYDGLAPDAYFWSSTTASRPSAQDGFIVPDEKGSTKPLERYANKDVVLRLPEGKTLREIHWLSIWSRQLKLSVGDIAIPRRELAIPRPLEIAPLSQLAHGLKSGAVTIVDAQTLLISDFHYDGLGPDAYFWLTRGPSGLSAANSLKLRDENGQPGPLRKYQGETIVVSLPDEFTIYDFDFFGVWCKQFAANFGQTQLPAGQQVVSARVPPSPKMLGIKPENKLNCEILYDDLGFEIRWVLDGDDIVMQLVGKIEPGEYMAFGLGKDDSRSDMNNADAVVAWVERPTGQVHAADYWLGSKQQCANDPKAGSCPDVKLANGSDSLTLLHGAIVNGYSMVTFKRPQLGVDELYDQHVYSDGQQSVIWAIGTLNKRQEIGYHRLRTRANMFIDFARNPQWNCPIPDLNASMHNNLPITSASQLDQTVASAVAAPEAAETSSNANAAPQTGGNRQQGEPSAPLVLAAQSPRDQSAGWFIPQVVCPSDRTFYAQIGPTAGKRGYAAQTGRASWIPPVSWYVNGLLVPELVVERGLAYRFFVEGGNDKTAASRRHPLYLTDSPEGGFDFKTDSERMRERIFGGVAMRAADGQFVPTAEGRLCEWKPTNATLANPDAYQTFSAYQRTLKLDCLAGQGALLKFAPDASTPDVIYYQCYTNRFMGWRIRVVDSCADYISSQLNQLKQHQQLAAAGSNRITRSDSSPTGQQGRARAPTRSKDSISRRESSAHSDLMDLSAQASDARLLSFEAPPPGLDQSGGGQQQRAPLPGLLGEEYSFLQPGAEFGDEFAASEGYQQNLANQLGPELAMSLNSSFMGAAQQNNRYNLSTIEQILKLSPSDLEFLDDSQLDLVSAVALASSSNPGQFLQNLQQPLPLKNITAHLPPNRQNSTLLGTPNGKSRTPKGLYSYMRRLASIYQPMQQQLAAMLSLQSLSPNPVSAPSQSGGANSQQQQQQQLASLHQQILAAAALVPTFNQANKQQVSGAQSSEPSTSASSQSSSFSLASLVPKPKIDLSKSNLGKRFNKLRIKTGRKYEPAASNQVQKQQPPTPENQFNYDIFNKQLMQLEERRKQFQNMENFAAALAMANGNVQSWQVPPMNLQHHQNYQMGLQQYPLKPSENMIFSSFEPQPARQQQHQMVDPLQQQQSALNILENIEPGPPRELRLPPHPPKQHHERPQQQPQQPQQQQQAVFITKLPQQTTGGPAGAQAFVKPTSNKWQHQDQIGTRYPPEVQKQPQQPQQQQQQQPSQALPSYLDTTDYNSIRQSSPATGQMAPASRQPTSENGELLSSSDGTNHYLFRQNEQSEQPSGAMNSAANSDNDHMMAIERYSKQSSERRAPSVVFPVTGEQVFAPEGFKNRTAQRAKAQPVRYSSTLIDNHIVEPSYGSDNPSRGSNSATPPSSSSELEPEQASDLRRLNASDQEVLDSSPSSDQVQRQQQSTTTELPTVLLKPVSVLDFFASDPPATTTMAYATRPPVSSTTTPSGQASHQQASREPTSNSDGNELALKTNLIEPISSTLVPQSSPPGEPYNSRQPSQASFNLDTGPFTPIEFTGNIFGRKQQVSAPATTNLLAFRLRPPALVESMISQYRSPFRPEPPVQVASYLTRHLAAGGRHAAARTSQQEDRPLVDARSSNQTDASTLGPSHSSSEAARSPSGLIILKPSPLSAANQAPQTYALKPEYMTTSRGAQEQAARRPPEGRKSLEDRQATSPNVVFYASNDLNELAMSADRRLAGGGQFDRLSSLSSPPSTSMVLDPMQVSNSVQTYDFHNLNEQLKPAERQPTTTVEQLSRLSAGPREAAAKLNSSQQTSDLESGGPAHSNQTSPAAQQPAEFNILQRDNNTDNAILSHVMSLISANAVPTPPLIPMASAYSSADYFLPVGGHSSHHHHFRRQASPTGRPANVQNR